MNDTEYHRIHDQARENNIPVMKEAGMKFLIDLIQKNTWIQNILEIGTAVGLSAIEMARIRWDMQVDTLEINPDMVKEARKNIERYKLSDRIHVHEIDGVNFYTDKIYDLIFVDAAKAQYRAYLEHFLGNARKGTLFVFDNMNFHGIVDHPNLTKNRSTKELVHKIQRFRNTILVDERFSSAFYQDIGDGIIVSRLKGDDR